MSENPEVVTDEAARAQAVADRMAAARAARAAKAQAAAVIAQAAPDGAAAVPDSKLEPEAEVPAVPEPTLLEKVAANQEASRQAKIAALRAAKVASSDPIAEPVVKVRVLKRGGGQISMGEHISGLGDLTYDAGETPSFPLSIAKDLEDKGLVEIE